MFVNVGRFHFRPMGPDEQQTLIQRIEQETPAIVGDIPGFRGVYFVRTSEDELIDKLSVGVQSRRGRVRAAELTPAVSAVLVLLNLEIGEAPEMMRSALQGEKGRSLLQDGLRSIGRHLVKELVR